MNVSDQKTPTDDSLFIDSLVHATGDGTWLGGTRYDASIQRLLSEMDQAGVTKACLVVIANHVANDDVRAFTLAYPTRFIPIGSIDPSSCDNETSVDQAVRELSKQRFAGLKLHPRLNGYDPLDSRCLAAIKSAGQHGMPVFLDTLFRQTDRGTRHQVDIVDEIAVRCRDTRVVLLHGCGPAALELFELVRAHGHLILDLSFTLLRYAGSSVDQDISFLCRHLDQRVTFGSDFPEYTPHQAAEQIEKLIEGCPADKRGNVFGKNLSQLFADWPGIV